MIVHGGCGPRRATAMLHFNFVVMRCYAGQELNVKRRIDEDGVGRLLEGLSL